MWRPDNWEKVKPRNTSEGCASGAYNNGVEAGADAMLEALKKEAAQVIEIPDNILYVVLIPEG